VALHDYYGDDDSSDHAPYIPPELTRERAERIQAMDGRLQEVLGDAVEVEDEDKAGDDERLFDFQPSPEEQVKMAEYGSIIVEHRWFVEHLNQVQLAAGDDGYVMNLIQVHTTGFDVVMRRLWELLQDHLRLAQ
jgi:hypothetical protein